MNDAPEEELAAALTELEAIGKSGKRRPGRWEARALLIPLGRLVLARGEAALASEVARAKAAVEPCADAWAAAIREELSLSCAEHVQGTEERYLTLPNFDWEYVLTARERLEARVVAARALGEAPPEVLWAQVGEADARVKKHAPRG